MTFKRRNLIKARLSAVFVLAGMAVSTQADTVYDCFKVVSYDQNWHVECTLDGFSNSVDIAIDDNVYNGWRTIDHGSMGVCYLAPASSKDTVDAGTFIGKEISVEFPNQSDFIVAFVIGCSGEKAIDGYLGWIRATYDRGGGQIVLKGGAINTTRGGSIVVGIEEPASDFDWQTIDQGDHLELAANCIPPDASGRVVVPREIDGKPVTAIGEHAFSGCGEITSLIIPDSISDIGYMAFAHCTNIVSLSIPSSVTNLSAVAFEGCSRLQSLSLYGPALVMANAVKSLPLLRNLEFGTGVREIRQGAVSECSNLITVTIPGDVERINAFAFGDCPSLASVAVHYLTNVEASSFPDGCEITRYGIHLPNRIGQTPLTDAEFLHFVDIVGRDLLVGRTFVAWSPNSSGDSGSRDVDRACVRLGLYPVRYTTYPGSRMTFYFGAPTIRILDFDQANRIIKLKVDPPDGSYVAMMPMLDYFHLVGIHNFGTAEQQETDIPLANIRTDFTEYKTGNGLFTLTYPETNARFFYFRVGEK